MSKANGIILKLSTARQSLFHEAHHEQDFFAEAVDRFAHSRAAPLICFIVSPRSIITHIARGRRGVNAGTGQSRLNVNDIMPLATKGICIPLSYWKRLEVDNNLKGPRGGRRLPYSNVGRYFDNSSFATMIKGAWVGTTILQSQLLENWMKDIIASGRSLTFAVKTGKPDPDDKMGDTHVQPDLGLDGLEEDFVKPKTQTVKVQI